MLKCKVCGKEFEASNEKYYIARENVRSGIAVVLAHDEEKLYDAFDCPYCGCQFIAQERKWAFVPVAEEEPEEEKPIYSGNFEEEQSEDCDTCKFNEDEDCVKKECRNKILGEPD